jgi:hypothetical protein
MVFIYSQYSLSVFSKLFQMINTNISVGPAVAYVKSMEATTPITRERIDAQATSTRKMTYGHEDYG